MFANSTEILATINRSTGIQESCILKHKSI